MTLRRLATAALAPVAAAAAVACGGAGPVAYEHPAPAAGAVAVQVHTACGIGYLNFDGRSWQALATPRLPPGAPAFTDLMYTDGAVTRPRPDRLHLQITDPRAAPVPAGIEYEPMPDGTQPPICQ